MISKPKGLAPSSSNVTKSTSVLPPATKNTSDKNEETKIRDNKMKKAGSSTAIQDPKKRLMVEEAKGKVSEMDEVYMYNVHVCEREHVRRGREERREREREREEGVEREGGANKQRKVVYFCYRLD